MSLIITHGANSWCFIDDGGAHHLVSRIRGSDSNDQPKSWVWTVRAWRGVTRGPRGFQRQHWHTLPRDGPKAKRIAGAVERMLQEVRP